MTDEPTGYFTRLAEEGGVLEPATLPPPRHPEPLKRYMTLAGRCTDAPSIYHEACFWTVVGAGIGRSRYILHGPQQVYPNFFTCLLGPSSVARKSTCIILAQHLASVLHVHIIPAEVTPESLFQALTEDAQGIQLLPELSGMFATARKTYGKGLIEMLLRLYDSPDRWAKRTKKNGETVITGCHFNILGACTLEYMRLTLASDDEASGLTARFLFVCYPGKQETLDSPRPLEEKKFAELCHRIRESIGLTARVLKNEGAPDTTTISRPPTREIERTKAAIVENGHFQHLLAAYMLAQFPDWGPALAARLAVLSAKVALCSAAVAGHDKINAYDYECAASFVARLFIPASDYGLLMAMDVKGANLVLKVEKIIRAAGSIARQDLLRNLYPYVNAVQLDRVIDTMRDLTMISIVRTRGGPNNTVRTRYNWGAPEDTVSALGLKL